MPTNFAIIFRRQASDDDNYYYVVVYMYDVNGLVVCDGSGDKQVLLSQCKKLKLLVKTIQHLTKSTNVSLLHGKFSLQVFGSMLSTFCFQQT